MKSKVDYQNELLSPEWQERRNQILTRDQYRCQKCLNTKYLPIDCIVDSFLVKRKSYGNRMSTVIHIPPDKFLPYSSDYHLYKPINSIKPDLGPRSQLSGYLTTFSYAPGESPMIQAIFRVTPSQEGLLETEDFTGTLSAIRTIAENKPSRIRWYFARMLNIHHYYYQIGSKAWEYPDSALITLCLSCHLDVHLETKIPVKDQYGRDTNIAYTPCDRCGGSGWFPEYQHRDNGICYKCLGARYIELAEQLAA